MKKILKEFIQEGFSLAKLNSIKDLAERCLYCRKYLGHEVGIGSSRKTFEIGEGEVIKLARSNNANIGIEQNKLEYANYYVTKKKHPNLNNLFPKVFQIADDGTWMTCERVLQFKKEDSLAILGIPYEDKNASLLGFIDWAENKVLPTTVEKVDKKEELIYLKLIKTNNWFKEIYTYIELNCGWTDLYEDNFGIALRNNKPCVVVLDNGCDNLDESINRIVKKTINSYLNENVKK